MDDIKYQKLVSLSTELLSQVRTEALISLRFLDVALYKLKFKGDLNTTIYTDGENLFYNPYHVFRLYKEENNLLLRTYLHIVLHLIFFHSFVNNEVNIDIWNLSTDICVENVINELKLSTLVIDSENPQIKEISTLKQKVGELTAERLYRYFMTYDIKEEEYNRLKNLFLRDDHTPWYESKEKISDEGMRDKSKNDDYKVQKKDELNEDTLERIEHEEKNDEDENESNNSEDYNKLKKDVEEEKEDDENGDEASNIDGDKNKSDTGEDENENADSTNKSDINDKSINEEERKGGEEVERKVRSKNINKNIEGDEYIELKDRLRNENSDNNLDERADGNDDKMESGTYTNDKMKKTKISRDEEGSGTFKDWKNISERTKEDLLMFETTFGDKTLNIREILKKVNEKKVNFEKFLSRFAVMGENIELNDEEFDNVYYTFGLDLYKNVPLVEPLEYKEAKRIKDFVIAIDVSGSVKGELVEKFLKKTYNILVERGNYFNKVNIHIVLSDAAIKNVYKISNLSDLNDIINKITLSGFGGTDFRPVFDYVDTLIESGELKNLKGLIYFTDGFGEYPKKVPKYDSAFVFMKSNYENSVRNVIVPPWAIKLVLEDE